MEKVRKYIVAPAIHHETISFPLKLNLFSSKSIVFSLADRLGHDKRYAIDCTKVKEIFSDWEPLSFHEFLLEQVNTIKNNKT